MPIDDDAAYFHKCNGGGDYHLATTTLNSPAAGPRTSQRLDTQSHRALAERRRQCCRFASHEVRSGSRPAGAEPQAAALNGL